MTEAPIKWTGRRLSIHLAAAAIAKARIKPGHSLAALKQRSFKAIILLSSNVYNKCK